MAKFVDKNPDTFYDYIELDKEVWYENPQSKEKSGNIVLTECPYLKGIVAHKDTKKRIVKFKNDYSCEFFKTFQVINSTDINVNDMASTKDINEVDLLLNLKNRLKSNESMPETFTNVGSTLLIVNPFKYLQGVYGVDIINHFIDSHEKNNPDQRDELLEPHLYDVILIAIRELLKPNSINQALVISGESGAGKTEAAKNAMQCITHSFSTKFNKGSNVSKDNQEPLENQILNCNPILEAFGNAKTVRNDNSSRFGKYVKIKINSKSFVIEGAMIKTYLLEKSRISELSLLERNYHIFYLFINGLSSAELTKYHLVKDVSKYKYLYKGENQIFKVEKMNDIELYNELIACFKSTGFNEEELNTIFSILAVVLLLGNLEMKKKDSKDVKITLPEVFDNIVALLQVDRTLFLNNLTKKPPSKHIKDWGSIYEDKVIKNFIDAIAKDLYNKLFLWIVAKLNNKLNKKSKEKQKYFGLLDIFGFECFQKNSIEQLCINYTNEQLQQLYIKDIFEADKEEFRKEGLEDKLYLLDASFKDNKDIIKCIEAFFYLSKSDATDERVYTTASNFAKEIDKADKNRLDKLKGIAENKIFTERKTKDEFRLSHTAKEVTYSTVGWAEKNIDEIKDSMLDCLFKSKNDIIQMIITTTTTKADHEAEIKKIVDEREQGSQLKELRKYLGSKFQMDMEALKASLEKCSHHYIRCIKPNEIKAALLFWDNFVFNQIQYLGILSTIQVRKSGFPVRRKYKDFYDSFKIILNDFSEENTNEFYYNMTMKMIKLLAEDKQIENQCLFGKSKVYLKHLFSSLLERNKEKVMINKNQLLNVIKVAYIHIRKNYKVAIFNKSVREFQLFYQVNRKGLMIKEKRKQVQLIQAVYLAKKGKEIFNKYIKNIVIIKNNFNVILSRRKLNNIQRKSQFISIRLQIYMSRIKEIQKKKMALITKTIIGKIAQRILHEEHNKVWNKVQPFMIRLLIKRKYNSIYKKAKIETQKKLMKEALTQFQYLNLIMKVKKEQRSAKTILTFGYTSMIANYYSSLMIKVRIIQKYLHQVIDTANVRKTIYEECGMINNDNDINNKEGNETITLEALNAMIFPFKCKTEKEVTEVDNDNKNKTINVKSFNQHHETNANPIMTTESNNYNHYQIMTMNTNPNERILILPTHNNSHSKTNRNKNKNMKYSSINSIGLVPIIEPTDDKIKIFARIADVDFILYDKSNQYTYLWAKEFDRVSKVNMINNTPIQLIYAGNTHTVVINSKGHIFSWGWNDKNQCGSISNIQSNYLIDSINQELQLRTGLLELPIPYYAEVGIPIRFDSLGKASKAVIGDNFTMVLNTEKNVLLFGDNSKGQLGQGTKKIFTTPKMLSSEFINKVIDIQTTEDMNVVLVDSNELYAWFISHEDKVNCKPRVIWFNKKVIINQISCGKNFMIILGKNGLVYGCGSNSQGVLAMPNDNQRRIIPEELNPLTQFKERMIQVRCGFKHVVCVSSNGNAYTWGNNTFGQLGFESTDELQHKPTINHIQIINSLSKQKEKEKIIQIAAGYRSSIFLTEKREIYYTGILSSDNTSSLPIKFNYGIKLVELAQINDFTPVRIMTSWNRSFSLFYISFADIRQIYKAYQNVHKINSIINLLAEKWITETVLFPHIPQIAKYFKSQ